MIITKYRDHTITINREECLGGWPMLYFSVFRDHDGYECVSSFTEGEDSEEDYVGYMKSRIDEELDDPDPWGELAEEASFLGHASDYTELRA